ncbi:hypothetical protein [Phenylobacterium sp.]|jgi:hypothetical protein|uniref:hypothetical protein n=1 Tax=Phenylobacterium sp. TaxID=1871053 RepID=UPI002E3265BF|nr:hypothetical protein [Phenylobacterium sp.]HEX2561050.1 hypothetical protein [Phenylobacterium sp.]
MTKNRTLMALLAATTLAAGVPAVASAQDWGVNQRQAQLDQRIDAGVRSGQLTEAEAARLRDEFQDIAQLEQRYRYGGLNAAERAELDRRFDQLSASIRDERRDRQAERPGSDGWQNINERQVQLDQRIDAGVRSGQLTEAEAARLQAEFQDLSRLERRYRADGLTPTERADLDRQFDQLSARIRDERRDWQAERPGSGEWQNLNQRQARLEQRIDAGVRNGQLTQAEAARLRAEFQDILRLERRYRQNGLSPAERADLDQRFDQLAASIRDERRDRQADRWENLNERQAQFQDRLNRAVQDRRLNSRQAMNLRMEFDNIARLEQNYRRDGLSRAERADLDMRFDRLQANFRASVNASSYGYGYGQAPNLFDYLFGLR